MIRRGLLRFAIVVASAGLALLCAEAWVRVFHPGARGHVVPSGLLQMDADLGWRLTAGAVGIHRSAQFTLTYTINSLGFRDERREVARAAGVERILLYGDSQVFGWGIPLKERFSNRLENDRREVWNLAVPGYGLDQEVLSYRRDGRELDANTVVFYVGSSTLSRLTESYIYKKFKPRFRIDPNDDLILEPVPKADLGATDLLYRALSPFYLPYYLERRLAGRQEQSSQPTSANLGDLAMRLLLEAQSIALRAHHDMVVLSNLHEPTRGELRGFCRQHGMGLLEISLEGRSEPLRIGGGDPHWNGLANRIIAQQLSNQLEAEKPAPPAADPRSPSE
jgi:hypothetical protein